MCGICGEIRWDDQSADIGAVTRMTAAMARAKDEGLDPGAPGVWEHILEVSRG